MTQNTKQRVVVGAFMLGIVAIAIIAEKYGLHITRWLGMGIVIGMIAEMVWCVMHASAKVLLREKNWLVFGAFAAWLVMMFFAMSFVGHRPWIILLLLIIICAADIGAWFFGQLLGGDKMWERLSAHKTWSGQIAGVVCGTAAAMMYGLLGTNIFMPQLLWIGIGVSLLSQYGDLTASWIKRRLGIKDFGTILPGHGGLLDRFDGWIYVLPLIWLILL